MKPIVLGALGGYLVWSVLWLVFNALALTLFPAVDAEFQETQAVSDTLYLALLLAASVVCSLAAGRVASMVGKQKAQQAVLWLAGLLLLTGIGVEAGSWNAMPVWYHLVFLVLLVPACLLGAQRAKA